MAIFDAIRDILFRLTPYLPGIVVTLILLGFSLLGVLIYTLRRVRAAKGEDDGTQADRADLDPDVDPFATDPDDIPLLPLRQSFRHALKILRSHVSGRDWRYAIPWYLLLGPEQSGKSSLAGHTGMDLPVGHPADDLSDIRPACKWWFFDRGVLLDISGGLIRQRDGRGSNTRAWDRFLGYLDRFRPRRPADGVILTIPIEDFLDDTGALRSPDDIMQRADGIYKKLWQAQTRLGLAFPVYVVVTKLDRLPGFQSLIQELPDHALADMLGWSSPYSFETEFREGWVDEVMETVGSALQAAEMEIFATTGHADSAEEIFSLPTAFAGLREPLRMYLRQVFKPSVYHENFSLRGVWFTGDSGMEDIRADRPVPILPGVFSGPRMRQAYPVFTRDLFETKIFPERNLARPVKRALLARNKIATAAQAASLAVAVLGGLTLWYQHDAMQRDVQTVEPFIREVNKDASSVMAAERSNPSLTAAAGFNRERALSLLEGMAALETGSFFSVVIPSSWFADIDDQVVHVTTNAFNLFILQSLGAALDERGTAIGAGRLPPDDGPSVFEPQSVLASARTTILSDHAKGHPALSRGPEYDQLNRYTRAIKDFETAVQRYNQLRNSQDLEDVRRLVAYLFAVQLPETFLENSNFYEDALSGSNYRTIPIDAYRRDIDARFADYMKQALASLYGQNPMMVALRDLATALDDATNSRSATIGDVRALQQKIAAVRTMMDDPSNDWIDDPAYDPSIAYATIIDRIGGLHLLGPEQATLFDQQNRDGLAQIRSELPELRTLALGAILAKDDDHTVLRLAPDIAALAQVMDLLADQPFMKDGRFAGLPAAPPTGSAVRWDAATLDEGLDLVSDFNQFMKDELDRVPRSLQPFLRSGGAHGLERTVNDRIDAAMIPPRGRAGGATQSEEALRNAIGGLADANGPLTQILQTYDELGLEDSYLDLLDLSVAVSFSLLDDVDTLFASSSLYAPRSSDLEFWDGKKGLAEAAFNARDPGELRAFLVQQRARAEVIANGYAKPLVSFLSGLEVRLSDHESGLLTRWRRILDELSKYDLKQADNSVAELERFITGPMQDVTFATCAETISDAVADRRSGDFFLNRISLLSRAVRSRCLELAGVEAQTAYSAIADAFDNNLAGRYPFTAASFDSDMREVSPRDLKRFFARYDREAKAARTALEQAPDLGFQRDRALEFLTRMDRVRAFFDPWLSSPAATDAPVFNLSVRFRVNQQREVGGDQLIAWQMSSGPDTITLRGGKTDLRWALGEPITLSLRWAENSPVVPANSLEQPALRVDGKTAVLTYDNVWSLIELIRRHQAGPDDFPDQVDPQPHTLRLDIPTRPAAGGTIEVARLFVRVELSAPKDGQSVPLVMTPFPYDAPRLTP